ncbi:hypothetical protein KR054_006984, partial [Drosophila jambulina]
LLSGAESSIKSQKYKEFLISEAAKKGLMKLDKDLISNLMEYSDKLKQRITLLQRLAAEIRQPLEAAKGVEEEYLSNPLHSFPLIRHMHQDWKYLEEFMRRPVGEEQILFLEEKLPELPLKSDGDEATEAMYRMARTYNATPWDMAHGLIDGIQFRNTLTALDCFEIGKLYLKWGFLEEASQWFNITSNFDQNSKTNEAMGLHQRDLALLQARSLVELGQDNEAIEVLMEESNDYWHDSPDGIPSLPEDYSRLCQSSHDPIPSRLHCRFNSSTSPFLILAPLKMEEISLDPYIIVYHEVLPAKNTEEIILFGEPKMKPTYSYTPSTGHTKNNGRTALGAWVLREDLQATDSPFQNLKDVVRDITGLKIGDGIEIQLLMYGFGAHCCLHTDYFDALTTGIDTEGDRIATVLFYVSFQVGISFNFSIQYPLMLNPQLNDAPHGGATAFTDLNIKVPAERGKVLFFYNLKGETLDLDLNTTHAACPVFQGFKY